MSRRGHEKNIFKWNKSRPDNLTKQYQSDVQKWIKGIEEESQTSRNDFTLDDNRSSNLIPDDTAIYEAQQLLDNWMEKQTIDELHLQLNDGDDDLSYSHSDKNYPLDNRPTQSYDRKTSSIYSTDEGKYDNTLSIDVDDIIKGLMDKPVINDQTLKRIIDDEPIQSDPLMSMEARLTQTRERARAKREQTSKSRKQIELKNSVAEEAKKQILNEETVRRKQVKEEDKKIKLEMIKIRKAMHQEKEKARIENESKKKYIIEAEEITKKEIEKHDNIKQRKVNRRIHAEDKMRDHVFNEMEDVKMKEKAKTYKLTQKYFFAWHNYCVKKSYQHREIKSLIQWKSKLRYWNRWQRYIELIKIEREVEISNRNMRYISRQSEAATTHYRVSIIKKCFIAWKRWLLSNRGNTQLKQEHEIKKLKMETFLNALTQLKSIDNNSNNETIPTKHHRARTEAQFEDKVKADPNVNDNKHSCKSNMQSKDVSRKEFKKAISINSKHIPSDATTIDTRTALSMEANKKKSTTNDLHTKLKLELKKTRNKSRNTGSEYMNPSNGGRPPKSNISCNEIYMKSENIILENHDDEEPRLQINQDKIPPSQNKNQLESQSQFLMAHPLKSNKNAPKPVLSEMERRAQQRAMRKAEVEEIKRKRDEDKLKELQAKEKHRIDEEMHLKAEKSRLYKEKKEFEKKQEFEKQQRLEAYRIKCQRADSHRQSTILRLYGLRPWIKLLGIKHFNIDKAILLNSKWNQQHMFIAWKKETLNAISHRKELADKFLRCSLLRKSFKALRKNVQIKDHNKLVAIKHNNSKIKKHFLSIWQCYVTNERLAYWTKESEAEAFHEKQLIVQSLKQWKMFVSICKHEREQEKRKDRLRNKVRGWLPDFEQNKNIQ